MSDEFEGEYQGGTVKRFLYVNRRAPHGTIYPHEMLEMVLITTAFDQDVSVVFLDDGVYQLRKDQDTKAIGIKNFTRAFRALDDYDVEKLYVERESLEARGLTAEDLLVPVAVVSTEELREIMDRQDVVLGN